jgi:hypothetical protein
MTVLRQSQLPDPATKSRTNKASLLTFCQENLHRMPLIRLLNEDDWPAAWAIIEPVFRAGRTYVYPPEITEEEARRVWVDVPAATYVAEDEGEILGTLLP